MSVALAEYAPSKNGGSNYSIILGGDGVTYCNCPGWKNRKNCKHLLDWTLNKGNAAVKKLYNSEDQATLQSQTSQVFEDDTKMNNAINMAIQMLKGD